MLSVSLLTLGGVGIYYGINFIITNTPEFIDEIKIEPRNKTIRFGKEKSKGGYINDKVKHLSKELESDS